MAGLKVLNLRKRYGDITVVDDLSFEVAPGEIFGLIGPNGAGKSTTMKMIIGLLQMDAGSITLDGQHYDPHNPQMRSLFGIVPQEIAIYPDLTAVQNLRFFGALNGVYGRRLHDRVDYVLELTGLVKNANQAPSTFSGGMSRRLNFGIALLHEPRFVILDEPTVGIDPQSRANLLDCVRALGKSGVGVLYASHYMEEVEAVCDRLAIIDHGRALRQGTLDELLDRTRIDLSIKVTALPDQLFARLRETADLRQDPDGTTTIVIRENLRSQEGGTHGPLLIALQLIEDAKIPMLGFKAEESSLESLFLKLTGRTLRD